jgi:hypothetical protein
VAAWRRSSRLAGSRSAFAWLAAAVVITFTPLDCRSAEALRPAPTSGTKTIWGYEFVEVFAHQGISSLTYRDADERIDLSVIRDVTPEVAASFIDDEINLFDSLFTLKRTGYPGQTTRYIECPPELRPRYGEAVQADNTFRYFRAFANANFVAGVSAPDLVVYRLLKGYLFCSELEAIFEIEHFCPLAGEDRGVAFLDRLGCPETLP